MRVLFMGTPDFAVPSLEAVVQAGHEVVAVVCQPDRATDRKGKPIPVPTKAAAQRLGLPIYAFEKIREHTDELRTLKPDVGITAAYGQILTQEILDIPTFGVLNVHASLLPKYRGSAPIQWAIINGETETGVTIMQTERGLDCGDILAVQTVPIPYDATAGDMFAVLKNVGAKLLVETLEQIEQSGKPIGIRQNEREATKCAMLKKEDGLLDFSLPADVLYNRIRGLNPWPSAFTYYNGQLLKIHKAEVCDGIGKAGEVIKSDVSTGELIVACGVGALRLLCVQQAGKCAMPTEVFLRGHTVLLHTVFTSK